MGVFTPAGRMAESREGQTATLLQDGRMMVIGGVTYADNAGESRVVSTVEIWDPATRIFSTVGSLASGLVGHTATLLDDGRVLVVGGSPQEDTGSTTALIWDPVTASFVPTGSLAIARSGHTATRLPDGRVLVIGGASDGTFAGSAEIWDPATGTLTLAGSPAAGRVDHTATLLPDDRVLVVGGMDLPMNHTYVGLASAEIWDPTSETFRPTGSLFVGRPSHTATLLDDGRVLVVGGGSTHPDDMAVRAAELWDPTTGTFSSTGAPSHGRANHSATLLGDGRVLVVGGGGYFEEAALPETELWDPRTDLFDPGPTVAEGRASHTATLLPDGRVLVIGGAGHPYLMCPDGSSPGPGGAGCFAQELMQLALPTAEIFDPGP